MTYKEIIEQEIKILERKTSVVKNEIDLSNLKGKIYGLQSALITFESMSTMSK